MQVDDEKKKHTTCKKKASIEYAKFIKENYKRIATENPGVPMIQLMPKLVAAWKVEKAQRL